MATTQRSLQRITRIASSSGDARQVRADVLAELRLVVAFDAFTWVLTDPVTGVGVSPVAEVPSFAELPRTVRLKYLAEVNRWTDLAQRGCQVGLLSEAAADPLPPRSAEWRDFLACYRISDVASVVFVDPYGTWGFLDLWRAAPGAFAAADVDFLTDVSVALTPGLRRVQAESFELPPRPSDRGLGPVVIVLDDELRVQSQTPASGDWLERLLPADPGRSAVPASVLNVAAQLLAVEHDVDRHPALARGHLADGLWVTLRAARLGAGPGSAGDRAIAVTIEESSAADRTDVFSRVFGLSPRERELVGLLTVGDDTRALGRRLGISHHTVQDHLKSIFAKTGAPTRQVLVARATGR